ncbi:MAG TPA: Uma2 family endonuclease [Gemmatimonadaceae bacterium]|jgi:Uma2 family endonuclease
MPIAANSMAIVAHAELPYHPEAEQLMVMPSLQPRRWTVREVSRLIDARPAYTPRYELVNGELLVTPAPTRRHQRVIIQLAFRLQPYLTVQRVGELLLGPDVRLREGTLFEPDLCIVPAPDGRLDKTSNPISHPLLICEALSPSSVRHDRFTKRRAFQRDGVPDYWVVDGAAGTFEVWHPHAERAELIDSRLTWRPAGCTEPFELDVKAFFASIADGAPLR